MKLLVGTFNQLGGPSRGLLRVCKIVANLRLKLYCLELCLALCTFFLGDGVESTIKIRLLSKVVSK